MLFLVVLSLALMALDTRVAAVARIRAALAVGLLPLQYVVSEPLQLFQKAQAFLIARNELIKENNQLKTQQLLLKIQIQRLATVESENNQLKALMHSSAQLQGKVLIAQLLSVDSDPFIRQMVLDKGARDGVFLGQPVLDSSGVIGKIIQAGPLTSRVLLINDPHSGLPVQVMRNGLRAIVMGDSYTGKLRVVNVTQTTDIRKGDVLITSGLGAHFPEGYRVGVVTSVVRDPGLQFATIDVEPSARLDRAKQVVLVWPNRQIQPKLPVNMTTKMQENNQPQPRSSQSTAVLLPNNTMKTVVKNKTTSTVSAPTASAPFSMSVRPKNQENNGEL